MAGVGAAAMSCGRRIADADLVAWRDRAAAQLHRYVACGAAPEDIAVAEAREIARRAHLEGAGGS